MTSINLLLAEGAAIVTAAGVVFGPVRAYFKSHHDARTADKQEILDRFAEFREENTRQHEEGRADRAASEARLIERHDRTDSKVESLQEDVTDVRERTARLEGGQAAIMSGAEQLPQWQSATGKEPG